MLTWLFRLFRRWRLTIETRDDVYVSEATLMEINRERGLRRGSDR